MSTGTAVATTENAKPKSVITSMADRFGMSPQAFEATVRATCMPQGRDVQPMTREEFAAGIMVAEKYTLNPILREIYFYPRRGGGIVPVVSIDGWLSLINRRKELDGIEFDEVHDEKGKLVSITCRIYRSDRKHPTIVTEHLSECWRDTPPWKMSHRMLRHKALIQCARYAFGFAGIHDEDEAERIVEATAEVVSGPSAPPPPPAEVRPQEPLPPASASTAPAAPPAEEVEEAEIVEAPAGHNLPQEEHELLTEAGVFKVGKIPTPTAVGIDMARSDEPQHPPMAQEEPFDPEAWLNEARERFQEARTEADVSDVHEMFGDTANDLGMIERQKYEDMLQAAEARVRTQGQPEQAEVTGEPGPAPEEEEEDDTVEDGPVAPPALKKSAGQIYVERLRSMLADRSIPYSQIAKWWNDTKAERADLIRTEHITKAERNELLEQLNDRREADAHPEADVQKAGPSAPPSEEDEITRYDREFRARVDACQTLEEISNLSAGTLGERAKFAGDPLQAVWKKLVADKRKALAGVA